MDYLRYFLALPELQSLILAVIGFVVTLILNRAAEAFRRLTGIQIEARHREALHEAVKSGVESAIFHGPDVALGTLKAHVVQHLRESVPDALKALTPGDGTFDRLVERYAREALNKIGEPK